MMPRRAGSRRHYLELQSRTARVADGDGYLDTWTTYGRVWGAVVPASASSNERATAQTQQAPITHLVTVDYRDDLRASHRLRLDGSRLLYIQGVQDDEERRYTLVLSCEERAA